MINKIKPLFRLKNLVWYFLSALLFVLLSNLTIEKFASGKLYNNVLELPENKVGLVLGTSKRLTSGRTNLFFKYRMEAASRLYKEGKVKFLLVSGDNRIKNYNEPEDMKKALMKLGVPENRIFLDYAGFRTFDSVIRARDIFSQHSITIISQSFHNKRAVFLARKNGISAVAFNAREVNGISKRHMQWREVLARTKVFIDFLIGTQPKFLGQKITIN